MNNTPTNRPDDVSRATLAINAFMPWLLIVTGIAFNLLIVLGMRTKNFRSLSTSFFMTVGAVNDLTSIPILLFAHWLHLNFPHSITRGKGSDFLCKFFNFYGWGQADFGMMLISAMAAERAYVILRPMTTVDLVKRAKIVVAICVFVVVAKEFHFWFSSVIVSLDRKDRLCDVAYISASYHDFYRNYWPWLDTSFVTFCFVVMVVSNSVLICHVRRNRNGNELQTSENTPDPTTGRITRSGSVMSIHAGTSYNSVSSQVTKMLMAESLALFLLSYPFSVHLMVTSQIDDLQDDPAKAEANALAFNIVFYLLYANKCVTFLIYCCAGKKFRKAVVNEVFCQFSCGKYQFGKDRKASVSGEGIFKFGGSRKTSVTGEGTFQNPTQQQQQQQQQLQKSTDRLMPLRQKMTNISCISCTRTET